MKEMITVFVIKSLRETHGTKRMKVKINYNNTALILIVFTRYQYKQKLIYAYICSIKI